MNEEITGGVNSGDPEDIEVEIISVDQVPIMQYASIGMLAAGAGLLMSMLILGLLSILKRA